MKSQLLKEFIRREVKNVLREGIADDIFRQLGGNRFVMMTGAKNIAGGRNHLQFKLPKAKDSINFVKITLNGWDTYDIEFGRTRMIKGEYTYKVVHSVEGIYNDQLQEIFTRYTGLYTKL